jgi:hypothetical protein
LRGENFIEGFWDCSGWLPIIIWGVPPGLAAAASRFEHQGQLAVTSKKLSRLHTCSSDRYPYPFLSKKHIVVDWLLHNTYM